MRIAARLMLGATALFSSATICSQTIDQSKAVTSADQALPPDVLVAIAGATNVKTIYPITGDETFSGRVLKADEIVFAPGANLTLTGLGAEWIAIVARKWKFADSSVWSTIRFAGLHPAKGADGADGARGADHLGETNRTGDNGDSGANGSSGAEGAQYRVPRIYIIAQEFDDPSGQPLPGNLRLKLGFLGFDGGQGGNGGRGGDGGNAGAGKIGASHAFDCGEGPGPGGRGGDGGAGGRGGKGGNAASGAQITYVSLANGIEQLSYARVYNTGGMGGQGGRPGKPGKPGNGGRGAPGNGWCGSSGSGPGGDYPDPQDFGLGQEGFDGGKGSVTAVTVQNLKPIF